MISKPVPANSFYHTCRYICNKPGSEVLLTEGVRGHSFKVMSEDFVMQQQMRPSKKLACFHGILSFYPGEKPSDEALKEISQKYLSGLGIINTQYAISKHTDKAHLHLHIVANMVNNEGKVISDSWIGLRGKKIAQRLTEEYKLIPALQKNLKLTHLEALNEAESNKYKVYIAIAENIPHCQTMDELEKLLLKLGIETQYKYKGQTREKQGISFKIGEYSFKGSQVDRKFSFLNLEKTIGLQQQQTEEQNKEQLAGTQGETPIQKLIREKLGITRKKSQSKPGNKNKDLSDGLVKGVGKIIEDLMKPEEPNQGMPYEFTQKGYMRKKKRQSGGRKM